MQTNTLNIPAAAEKTTRHQALKSGLRKLPEKQFNPKAKAASKQSKVLAMLQAPSGTTIAAMMKATKWQQLSVRGSLSGVVRRVVPTAVSSPVADNETRRRRKTLRGR